MDNQNTNQTNGINSNEVINNGLNLDNNAVPLQNTTENINNSTPVMVDSLFNIEQNNVVADTLNETPTIDNIVPIKPTLDSILNPSEDTSTIISNQPIENENTLNTLVQPTNNLVSEEPITPLVQPNNLMNEFVSEPVVIPKPTEEPIKENFSNDAVVDNSLNFVNNEINTIPNNMFNASPTVEPVEEAIKPINTENIVNDISNSISNEPIMNNVYETPTVENMEEIKAPVIESIENNNQTQATENSNEINSGNNPSVAPTEGSVEQPMEPTSPVDDFDAVPRPPITDDDKKKKKKGGSKALVLILIIILIGAIGFGVYYFLDLAKASNSNNSIEIKELKLELGNVLPTDIDDYAIINGYNKSNCTLNTDNVDTSKVGTSKFSITCGKKTEEGLVIIDDTTSPKVVVNDLTILLNSSLIAEDLIESCVDATTCSYAFITDVTSLTSKEGDYEVEILVSDEYNNQTIVKANITVAKNAPASYMTCTKNNDYDEEISASFVNSYRIGIDANNAFYNAIRTTEFSYNNLSDYNNSLTTYDETVGIKNFNGTLSFNEDDMKISIKKSVTLEEMNKDLNGNLPTNNNVLKAYLSGLGYNCN